MFSIKFSFKLLLLLTISTLIKSDTLNCGFRYDNFAYTDENFYKCFVHNPEIFNDKDVLIDKVEGRHDVDKTNDNVTAIEASRVNNFPTIVRKNFKNLEVIHVSYSNIKEISSQDLKHFPKLRLLFMQSNQIEYIYHDLFSYNPDLEIINLSYNKISHIDKRAFSHLEKLRVLHIDKNDCDDFDVPPSFSREMTLKIIGFIERGSCQSSAFSTSENPLIAKFHALEQKVKEQNEEIEDLKKQMKEREEVIKRQGVIIKDLLQAFQNGTFN
ncbi:hypothetical protein PVAND_017162 [Polypedilum vanderplanki]|uniref:Uncharacterized protein n=1 Tax=Polypedilum vanderplanki TaxID=319348 RepID=A0A9J6BI80_POLVA|nr:hypothetical protein PVAND_017162 [Polypedilum vanderplanki]